MCSSEWLKATFYAECAGFALSVYFNLILIKLLIEKPRNAFGNYKYLMMAFSFCGMIYSSCNLWTKPNVHITNKSFIVFTALDTSHISKEFAPIAVAIYGSCYAMMLSLLTIHFYYRYTSVTAPTLLIDKFSPKKLPLWMLFVLLNSAIWGLSIYYLCGPTESKDRELAVEFERAYCLKPMEYGYTGPQYFYENLGNGTTQFHLNSFLGIGILGLEMLATFSCMIYFGYRTYSTLNEDGITCFARKELQKQLFSTLICQTIIPTIFMYLPVSCMFIFPMFGVKIEALANLIPISVAIYPCMEPLVAMIMIKDFRKRVLELLCCGRSLRTRVGTIETSNTYNSNYSMHSFTTQRT